MLKVVLTEGWCHIEKKKKRCKPFFFLLGVKCLTVFQLKKQGGLEQRKSQTLQVIPFSFLLCQ